MKNSEKDALYEKIMLNVSKYIKKALNEEREQECSERIVFHPDYGNCAIRSCFDADTTTGDFYEVYCIEGDNEEYICELPYNIDIDDDDSIITAIDDAMEWENYKDENGIDDEFEDEEDIDSDEEWEDEDLDESYGDEEYLEDEDLDNEDLDDEEYDEPKYTLAGCDGNAFAVMGYVTNAMKKEGKTPSEIRAYRTNAMSGNYDKLLAVSMEVLDELNNCC